MYTSRYRSLLLALLLAASACGDDPDPLFGENISGVTYEFFDEEEGIHPSTIILDNPRNPFRFKGNRADDEVRDPRGRWKRRRVLRMGHLACKGTHW